MCHTEPLGLPRRVPLKQDKPLRKWEGPQTDCSPFELIPLRTAIKLAVDFALAAYDGWPYHKVAAECANASAALNAKHLASSIRVSSWQGWSNGREPPYLL